ncbi:MAG: acyl carrier protein [Archangium sp.]|nr:acyl carrier protein [Archangium sp.]
MNGELEKTIVAVLAEIAPEADLAALSGQVPFRDQLDLDSMDFLHFVQALDKKLHVDVPEADYPKLMTLDECVKYLAPRLPKG